MTHFPQGFCILCCFFQGIIVSLPFYHGRKTSIRGTDPPVIPIVDWISVLESSDFEYEFDIPETEYLMRIDVNAYSRILNNLLQNVLIHSKGNKVTFHISENDQQARIILADNGRGISSGHLPHIFERMYQCDQSRSAKGNGLGLSIVKELVAAHKGTIVADSTPDKETIFTILLPKSL